MDTKIKICLTTTAFSVALIPIVLVLSALFGFTPVMSTLLAGLVIVTFLSIALAFIFLLLEKD